MKPKLKPCPCGEVPEKLIVTETSNAKYATACGTCCTAWHVEFKTHYTKSLSELKNLAAEAWNDRPRGNNKRPTKIEVKEPDGIITVGQITEDTIIGFGSNERPSKIMTLKDEALEEKELTQVERASKWIRGAFR